MTAREKHIEIFHCALKYLHTLLPEGITVAALDKYYIVDRGDFVALTDIYEQFIQSAQNYQGIAHRQLLDEEAAICFDDWLNGYVRNGDQRIPIPIRIESSKSNIHEKHKEAMSDLNRHGINDGY